MTNPPFCFGSDDYAESPAVTGPQSNLRDLLACLAYDSIAEASTASSERGDWEEERMMGVTGWTAQEVPLQLELFTREYPAEKVS